MGTLEGAAGHAHWMGVCIGLKVFSRGRKESQDYPSGPELQWDEKTKVEMERLDPTSSRGLGLGQF